MAQIKGHNMATKKAQEPSIEELTDFQHARLRTEMYLGSRSLTTQDTLIYDEEGKPSIKSLTYVPAIYTAIREIIDNSLDEFAHGHGDKIQITYDESTREVSVEDNGRGIPIDWDEDKKLHKATLALTRPRAGRNFGARGEVAGTNGLGASIVNFCSSYFKLEIVRDGQKFKQEFNDGNGLVEDVVKLDPKITVNNSAKTGTKISFKLSDKVFAKTTLPDEFLKARAFEIALANPNLTVVYNGKTIKVKKNGAEKTLFPDGKPIVITLNNPNFRSKFILMPDFHNQSGEFGHSIVNNIPAFNGGTHMEAFRRLFVTNLLTALEKTSKRRKLTPNRSDVIDGCLLYNITRMTSPDFDSQSKTRLINEEPAKMVKNALDNPKLYEALIKKHKDWIDQIYERCALRTQKKDQSEIDRLQKQKKKKKIAKLKDATSNKRTDCILFLGEGDSAIEGMNAVRDPKIHGGLPLRGKIMNVRGENPKKVLESEALMDIMRSLGLTIGTPVKNRAALRYGKVYIATDQDQDGANIMGLIVNFLYTFWPELFDPNQEPYVYAFQTPLIILEKGKTRKYIYAHDYATWDHKDPQWSGYEITRAKGLGALEDIDWSNCLQNPVAFPIIDDKEAALGEALDLIFNGQRADDRKAWMGI